MTVRNAVKCCICCPGGSTVLSPASPSSGKGVPRAFPTKHSEAEINAYADSGEPYDKAGAYGIQGQGSLLVAGISGDYFNVVGLPVARLYRQLRSFGLL